MAFRRILCRPPSGRTIETCPKGVPRAPSKDYQRLETDASKSVEWDASRGTQVNGKSTPLRPPPDKFGGYLGGLESRKVRLQPRLVGVGSATRSSARHSALAARWTWARRRRGDGSKFESRGLTGCLLSRSVPPDC